MKTFTTILKVIAIGTVIAIGMSACAGTPKQMDEETLALKETFDNATWEVKPLNKNSPFTKDFRTADKKEISAFQTISAIQNAENFTWYALSAPELPGTFFFYRKTDTGSLLLGPRHELYKSTTIDEEAFASRIAYSTATWQFREVSNQTSTAGVVKLDGHGSEAIFFRQFLRGLPEGEEYDKWYSFTASELPGVIYYSFERKPAGITLGETSIILKGGQ